MAKMLLIEDDQTFALILEGFLQKHGHDLTACHNVKSGLQHLAQNTYSALLLDYRLPDGNGLEVLQWLRDKNLHIPTIMMTSINDVRTAVKAIRSGALDYITKPVNHEELLMVLNSALKVTSSGGTEKKATPTQYIEGNSDVSKKLREYVQLVGPTDLSVIIQGESGTGKEHVARSIHQASKRKEKPFVAIDCGALSKDLAASEFFGHAKGAFTGAIADKKGQFEVADGGTIFLDEIGNLSYQVQVQLLRAIQERIIHPLGSNKEIKVDVRILAATNDDLLNSVAKGEFREDLYHRLNEFKIQVPALRNRDDDLQSFINYFVQLANQELGRNVKKLSPEVQAIFKNYDWPGNLRELKNVIKRVVLLSPGEQAELAALPEEMIHAVEHREKYNGSDLKALNEANEKELIQETLRKVKYNKSQAARLLNIDRTTLYNKIEKYQIE